MKEELKVSYKDENVKIEVIRVAVEDGVVNDRLYDELFASHTLSPITGGIFLPFFDNMGYDKKKTLEKYPDVVICDVWSEKMDLMGDELVFGYNKELGKWLNLSVNLYGSTYCMDIFKKLIINK